MRYFTYVNKGGYSLGYINPLILTFDPKIQRDINSRVHIPPPLPGVQPEGCAATHRWRRWRRIGRKGAGFLGCQKWSHEKGHWLVGLYRDELLPSYIYIYLEPNWSLFLKVSPSKQGLFQSKQGSFGF